MAYNISARTVQKTPFLCCCLRTAAQQRLLFSRLFCGRCLATGLHNTILYQEVLLRLLDSDKFLLGHNVLVIAVSQIKPAPTFARFVTRRFFFLWGYLKGIVYKNNPHTLGDLKRNITTAINSISLQVLHKVASNMVKNVRAYIAEQGSYFEHMLQRHDLILHF
jgi:hypothetical protein